mmetsp:Transcript_65611/g.77120  ORF Transcript_65611/g.77120 Transcript_65611/m.77120 type:complete len:260 (+) Transcript_65611:68-847(+)
MRCSLSNLLVQTIFISSVIASTHAARPFPTTRNPLTQQAIIDLRGGGGLATTKVITKLGLAVGTTTALSAKTVLEKSGIENADPMNLLLTRRIGESILQFSIVAYFLLFQDASVYTALGIACIPVVVEMCKTLFDGTHKALGFSASGQIICLVISATFGFLFLNDSRQLSKDTLLKIHSGFLLSNGVLMGCFPKFACKFWGQMDVTDVSVIEKFISLWGFSYISIGTLSGCLATDMTTSKALGFGALPFVSRFVLSKFL